jgi:Mg2+-importing ATPase
MTFLGLLLFQDPPKAEAPQTVAALSARGVALKIVTGDDPHVGAHVASAVGIIGPRVLTGPEIRRMSDEALRQRASETDVFAAVEPDAKERIILALRQAGHVVGYMGDGINDASAIHVADVGISVAGAADVAREAADIVLLEHDLGVLLGGVEEGRLTFANTMKYVYMATSANFGNMFSMAGASLLLPFLPLLPKQILLLNLLTDLPEMGVARDRVDPEAVATPQRWDVARLRRFMLGFGLLSSVFDFLTFGLLLVVLRASPDLFRTGWFVESVLSACLVVLVLRTRRPFWRSPPGRGIALGTVCVVLFALSLPYTPLAAPLGLIPLPLDFLGAVAAIVLLYGALAEWAKRDRPASRADAGLRAP